MRNKSFLVAFFYQIQYRTILSVLEMPCRTSSNSLSVGVLLIFFYTAGGQWFCHSIAVLFSSILFIFVTILLFSNLFVRSFLILEMSLNFWLGLFSSSFGNKIFEPNERRVFTQLNPPINVCSNNSAISAFVESAIIVFVYSHWVNYLMNTFLDYRGIYSSFD